MDRNFFEELTTAELNQYKFNYEQLKETLPLDDFKRITINSYIYTIDNIIYSRNKKRRL